MHTFFLQQQFRGFSPGGLQTECPRVSAVLAVAKSCACSARRVLVTMPVHLRVVCLAPCLDDMLAEI